MKRYKKVGVLLVVLLVACIATFGVTKYEQHKEDIKNSEEVILEVDVDAVTAVSWDNEETSLSFHKDEEWIYDGDEAFPVDGDKIEALLSVFEAFGVSFIIENVEDYGQYGLDNPTGTIKFTADETEYEIKLGNYSDMDSERYVSIGDGNVYLVSEDPLEYFDAVLDDTMKHDETPSFEQVNTITFTGSENYSIFYEEESTHTYCEDDVYFVENSGETLPLDTENIDILMDEISSLSLGTYATYNATEEELAEFGMDAPELVITVDHAFENDNEETVEETFVLNISLNPEEQAAKEAETDTEKAEAMEVTAYARVGESQIIYEISKESYDILAAVSYDDLRHEEVLTADLSTVTQMDITLEGETYTITSEEADNDRTYYYQDKELEMAPLNSAIRSLSADSFTDEEAKEKLEISFVVYLDNENYPQVEVELYRYDGDYCLAVVDGETVALIERSQVVDLIEAVNAIVL